ncbi:flagellar hook-basal body complex protein [Rhodothermus marinus]|uniref:flagellar hook-basal body complex protein n=1 Tax=Rhodothermus marinus TaxID=29549 RepID=UPI001FB25D80|nr:flagellar hook-basal body complex protein [Rhodothermus marinus]
MYQLALGSVNNVNGLQQVGDNLWSLTSSSGDLALGRAGVELNRTVIVAGTLEMSNVDLATEFTDMIVTQRGYQASARIITTSDEMLQELVQLKR